MACPGPSGAIPPSTPVVINDDTKVWVCDGYGCDCGGIHQTCKAAKEAEGYTFVYSERAAAYQEIHDRERDKRLAQMSDVNVPQRVRRAIARARTSTTRE